MFITVFTADVGPVSAIEFALTLGEELCSRGKRVALIDASLTMSASLAGLDRLECEADKPQTCLPLFKQLLSSKEFQSSTYTSRCFAIPVFQAIEPSEALKTSQMLSDNPGGCVDNLAHNLGVLQEKFDVVIATNHLTLDDINGELAGSSDYVVLLAESEKGATNALHFFFSSMKRKVVLVRGCRISATFKERGLAGSFEFWVNKESPLTAFLMKGVSHFTHVGAENRVHGYNKTLIRKVEKKVRSTS